MQRFRRTGDSRTSCRAGSSARQPSLPKRPNLRRRWRWKASVRPAFLAALPWAPPISSFTPSSPRAQRAGRIAIGIAVAAIAVAAAPVVLTSMGIAATTGAVIAASMVVGGALDHFVISAVRLSAVRSGQLISIYMGVGTRRLIWALIIAALAIYSASQTSGTLGFVLAATFAVVGAFAARVAIRRRWSSGTVKPDRVSRSLRPRARPWGYSQSDCSKGCLVQTVPREHLQLC